MSDTKIEWATKVWNCLRGCTRVSAGCQHCYAERVAARFSDPGQPFYQIARRRSNGEPQWTGRVEFIESKLIEPLKWRDSQRVFVNSMSDVFHEQVGDETIDRMFAVMAMASRHTFLLLTKRPERMRDYMLSLEGGSKNLKRIHDAIGAIQHSVSPRLRYADHVAGRWPLRNVQLIVSAEDQATADARVSILRQTPAAVRGVSAEPLLGSIDFWPYLSGENGPPLDWVIVGGESGPGARPCNVAWIERIVADCDLAGVACFVKQLGSQPGFRLEDEEERGNVMPSFHHFDGGSQLYIKKMDHSKGGDPSEWPEDLRVREFPEAVTV